MECKNFRTINVHARTKSLDATESLNNTAVEKKKHRYNSINPYSFEQEIRQSLKPNDHRIYTYERKHRKLVQRDISKQGNPYLKDKINLNRNASGGLPTKGGDIKSVQRRVMMHGRKMHNDFRRQNNHAMNASDENPKGPAQAKWSKNIKQVRFAEGHEVGAATIKVSGSETSAQRGNDLTSCIKHSDRVNRMDKDVDRKVKSELTNQIERDARDYRELLNRGDLSQEYTNLTSDDIPLTQNITKPKQGKPFREPYVDYIMQEELHII